ncbi:MAG TPA: tetratricopeptide repeat protein [Planctomycetota bacterium]|nr:tetratricopeptide repeat protein [Planctomycetota bacterium]
MAKIAVRCPECQHEARVPEAFRGKKVRCLRCRAKVRVPGNDESPPSGPVVTLDEPTQKSRGSRETQTPTRSTPRGVTTPGGGGPSTKTRRDVQQAIREILGDYEHAIEDAPRGFAVDVRGVAFGLARTLVEDLIATPGVRDAKLAGGTGECRITVTLEGAPYDPDDSFADDDDETEIFRRPTASDVKSPLDNTGIDEASRKPVRPPEAKKSRADKGDGRAASPPASTPASQGSAEVDRLLEEGKDLVAQGDVQGAIDVLERAVRVDKNHANAVSSLGQAYARAGDRERARRAFKHLVTLRPDDADAHVYYAAVAMDCDRLDEAREALAQALKLDPESARVYRYAALLYEKSGDTERAKKFRAKYEQLKGK